ncbi:MAG: hypothetical protein AABX11_07005 [Nanoarchaeota archaeon]
MTNAQKQDYGIALLPRTLEVARVLAGERAKSRFEAYQNAVKEYNPKAQKTLNVYSLDSDGRIVGSNIFGRTLLDKVTPKGTRGASMQDLLRLSDQEPELLRGTYEDTNAVALRSLNDSQNSANNYLAKTLAKKLNVRSFKEPLLVTNLEIKDDERSEYGLILVPSKNTNVIVAPQLSVQNRERKFTFYDQNGLPIFNDETDKTGKRQVWTRDSGISRLYLYWNLILNSGIENLASSFSVGRVVEVSDEVAGADLAEEKFAKIA